MAFETSPAFQFYVKDWRSSRAIMRMTFAQRGMYLEMLLEQWETGSLPDCPEAVAHLIGGTVEEWTAAWPVLRRKFVDRRSRARESDEMPRTHDAQRRIVNLKLECVRKEKRAWRKTQQSNGRKGGLARARNVLKLLVDKPQGSPEVAKPAPSEPTNSPSEPQANPGEALANPSPSTASSSSSSSSTASATSVVQRGGEDEIADRAGALLQTLYPKWYSTYRKGAKLLLVANSLAFNDALRLVETWDDARLEKLARIVLTTDEPFIASTDRSFRIFAMKASWADDRLRQAESGAA